jgi:hypothetical protein
MNDLNRLDLDMLAAIGRERQADMRREARNLSLLREPRPSLAAPQVTWKWKMAIAVCAALPIVLVITRATTAGSGG